jgi:hypothetical protein
MRKLTHLSWRGACLVALAGAIVAQSAASAQAALPPIKHVFVVVEENESAAVTFGPSSPAPYLSKTLTAKGAFVPNYFGVGHFSLDNYIAMVSGQAPNPMTSGDCPTFANFPAPTSIDASGQETGEGCVYPSDVPTLMSQFDHAGLSWRAYEDGMGADPTRESATCGHPPVGSPDNTEVATPKDQYATRHDPFVYFHSVIDNQAECNKNVVNLSQLSSDLKSASTTPNYVFVTPNLCDDGHDAMCANGGPGGLAQVDTFLRTLVPEITSSPAFKQNGLLIVTFDEAATSDSSACCGEMPGPFDAANGKLPGGSGPGGGVVGAVLLSPFIKPGTRTNTAYNHYSMLGSVEDLFGLPRLADAAGTTAFGSDIFTKPPVAPRDTALKLKPSSWSHTHPGATVSYKASQNALTTFTVDRVLPGYRLGSGKTCSALKRGKTRPKHAKSCTILKPKGSFTLSDDKGANDFHFNGKLHGHVLAAGSYELVAVPMANGLTGKTTTAKFTVT